MAKQKKVRIVFDGEPIVMDHFSGVGHYIVELLRAIDRLMPNYPDVSVDIFVHYKRLSRARSFKLQNIRLLASPFSLRIANGLKIRNKQPPLDVIFGKGLYVFPNYTSWPLAASRSIPFIYDLSYEKYPQYASPPLQAFLSKQVWKSAKRAAMVATISNNSRDEIHEFYGVPKENINVFYPAVDADRYSKRDSAEIHKVTKKYGINGHYILFVGNIEPRKNLVNLLLAYENLPKELRSTYKLLLVGAKGWQDSQIHETVARLNEREESVLFPNAYVTDDDLPGILSGASVFVYPSIYEGFGIPPIEAMSCGVPVVCADNSSLPEAAGDAALYVNALSVDSITQALSTLLQDDKLRKSLIQKGYRQATKFSWEQSARKFIEAAIKLYE